jgi:hypothetical protein
MLLQETRRAARISPEGDLIGSGANSAKGPRSGVKN